ncbi:BRLZ protein [Geosmithia morbida]|uniref:BRLZ protein n=1 Tax=Geosmithia morbida TaxID=1094350 RepID=A0A9P4YQP3_9HYPO|nr:BRLZ protein [Geosmithia morbida]KAF4120024.1 BRLZ protein [Geosmithia morbida]
MSVAYEPRSFMHEGTYPPIGDEHDHGADHRYTDSDVAEHLSHYTAGAAGMLPDDRDGIMGDHDDQSGIMGDHNTGVVDDDPSRLDLDPTGFSSPIQLPMQTTTMQEPPQGMHDDANDVPDNDSSNNVLTVKPESPMTVAMGGGGDSPQPPSSSSRSKTMSKPDREAVKQADGKFHCPLHDCKEEVRSFSRKCEWKYVYVPSDPIPLPPSHANDWCFPSKHMDKHERPYRCLVEGCESLPGFTYSGGLLRHEREVHGKHGGPKKTVNCPHTNCKRHTGKGFSRLENLNEHLRRVHTANNPGETPPGGNSVTNAMLGAMDSAESHDDNESEKSGVKRKRRSREDSGSGGGDVFGGAVPATDMDEMMVLREEIKRVREENDKLKAEMDQQSHHSLAMMAQIAELQDALRHGLSHTSLNGPTAQLI